MKLDALTDVSYIVLDAFVYAFFTFVDFSCCINFILIKRTRFDVVFRFIQWSFVGVSVE